MTSFARHAEACGFDSVVLVEHAVVVSDYQSTYPYASSGKMPLPDDCRIPDPLDLMAYLAAVTERIGLATGVLVLPNHHAVVLAKRIATVDVLSGGRVRMCVGVGWMDEELRATGADPRSRGRRTDETIAAMRALWADSGPSGADFEGEFFSFRHAHSFPKPVQPGGVPIHIGGHSEAAARRAGRSATASSPWAWHPRTWPCGWTQVRESAEEAGRDPATIELSLSGYLPTTSEQEIEDGRVGRGGASGGLDVDERRPGPDPRRDVGLRRAVRPVRGRPEPTPAPVTGPADRPTTGRADRSGAADTLDRLRRRRRRPRRRAVRRAVRGRRRAGGPEVPRRPPAGGHPVRATTPCAGCRTASASTTGPSTR